MRPRLVPHCCAACHWIINRARRGPGHPAKDSTVIGLGMGSDWPSAALRSPRGGLLSRALGTAVHSLLEELARLRRILIGMLPFSSSAL